mmetsp:Transcript_19796/g.62756  ORF Transcript_19796/g.62756 Transcript_19796/m.62756 type:complete len:460 (+) Transcript_19796:557-1936(+)
MLFRALLQESAVPRLRVCACHPHRRQRPACLWWSRDFGIEKVPAPLLGPQERLEAVLRCTFGCQPGCHLERSRPHRVAGHGSGDEPLLCRLPLLAAQLGMRNKRLGPIACSLRCSVADALGGACEVFLALDTELLLQLQLSLARPVFALKLGPAPCLFGPGHADLVALECAQELVTEARGRWATPTEGAYKAPGDLAVQPGAFRGARGQPPAQTPELLGQLRATEAALQQPLRDLAQRPLRAGQPHPQVLWAPKGHRHLRPGAAAAGRLSGLQQLHAGQQLGRLLRRSLLPRPVQAPLPRAGVGVQGVEARDLGVLWQGYALTVFQKQGVRRPRPASADGLPGRLGSGKLSGQRSRCPLLQLGPPGILDAVVAQLVLVLLGKEPRLLDAELLVPRPRQLELLLEFPRVGLLRRRPLGRGQLVLELLTLRSELALLEPRTGQGVFCLPLRRFRRGNLIFG